MKQVLVIITAYLGWLTATAQTFFVETKQLPIRQYNALKKKLYSQRLPDEDITVVGAEFTLGPQQRYARVKTAVRPRPVVKYIYSLPDSVVRAIEVEVDSLNYLGDTYKATTAYREAPGRYPQFLQVYARIKQEMDTQLGQPAASQHTKVLLPQGRTMNRPLPGIRQRYGRTSF